MTSETAYSIIDATEPRTLHEVLFMVPNLMSSYILDLWPTRGAGIRVLRLVSKEICTIARRSVTSCTVTLGDREGTEMKRLALLVSSAQLKAFKLTIHTISGVPDPSPNHQLLNCTSHMDVLLASMGIAMSSVSNLQLVVPVASAQLTNSYCGKNRSNNSHAGFHEMYHSSILGNISQVPAAVCTKLAVALSQLQNLSLGGLCVDVSLAVFGINCPQLRSLRVDAVLVPISSLKGLHLWFPNLTTFTIGRASLPTVGNLSFDDCSDYATAIKEYLNQYVNDALPLLHECSNLKALNLELRPAPGVTFDRPCAAISRSLWENLPASLDDFKCDVWSSKLEDLVASSFMGRVQSLTLTDLPCHSLPELLLQAPLLKKLTILGEDPIYLMWTNDITTSELESLKTRYLSGFQLSCKSWSMCGSSKALMEMALWLPPMPNTEFGEIELSDGVVDMDFVHQLAHMCPTLRWLRVMFESPYPVLRIVEEGIVKAMAKWSRLENLCLEMPIKYSVAGFMDLCASLPSLETICINPVDGDGTCWHDVAQQLQDRIVLGFVR